MTCVIDDKKGVKCINRRRSRERSELAHREIGRKEIKRKKGEKRKETGATTQNR